MKLVSAILPSRSDMKLLGDVDENATGVWKLNNTKVGRYFRLNERRSNLVIEIRAGIVTFLAIAYILSINSGIISSSGGPCTSEDCTGPDKSFACRFTDPGFASCVDDVRKDLITATAASSLVACFIMGAFANMPLAVSTGMGLNAYFTYNVVGYYGTGSVSYKDALAAIFIEGWIFIVLSVTGARQYLIRLLPRTLALSMSAGIGLFLAYIGFQASEGIGLVTADGATLSTLGGCPVGNRIVSYFIPDSDTSSICSPPPGEQIPFLPAPSSSYMCDGHKMTDAPLWLAIAGLALMTILMSRNFRGAIIVGILFVTIIAWIPGHAASYLGKTSDLPGIALITFLYVDFCDCTGTLFSMANYMNTYLPNFIDEKKNFPRSTMAYCSDGIGIVVGSLMGTSPLTVFIESATGIREGGRTGVTALVTAFCFFVSLFFAPLLASIPVFATGPALILVGALMMANAAKVDWMDITKAVPAFLTIILMPVTYSIAYGVIGGIISYMIAHFVTKLLDFLSSKTNGAFGWHKPHEDIDGPEVRTTTFRIKGHDDSHGSSSDDSHFDDTKAAKIDNVVNRSAPVAGEEV